MNIVTADEDQNLREREAFKCYRKKCYEKDKIRTIGEVEYEIRRETGVEKARTFKYS